jgi:hypothetical protein
VQIDERGFDELLTFTRNTADLFVFHNQNNHFPAKAE